MQGFDPASIFRQLQERLKAQPDPAVSPEEHAQSIIRLYAGTCAIAAMQPLPVMDIVVLTPLQILMAQHIGRAYGVELSLERAKEVLGEVAAVVGLGMLAQQSIIALYKIGIPYAGGAMTFPLVFGATWAIGQVMDRYFQYLAADLPIDREALRALFKRELARGRNVAKEEQRKEDR